MLTNIKKRNEGFTIIEVLIVLAIAALILLIVFLAVPALQRNARNTSRKNDVAGILGALSEYTNNNGGAFPSASCTGTYAAPTWSGTCTTNNSGKDNFVVNAKVGAVKTVNFTLSTAAVTTATAAPALDTVSIITYDKCASATADAGANATSRSVVALYLVETGGGTQVECSESGS